MVQGRCGRDDRMVMPACCGRDDSTGGSHQIIRDGVKGATQADAAASTRLAARKCPGLTSTIRESFSP